MDRTRSRVARIMGKMRSRVVKLMGRTRSRVVKILQITTQITTDTAGSNGAWYGGSSAGTWGGYYAGLATAGAAGVAIGATVASLPAAINAGRGPRATLTTTQVAFTMRPRPRAMGMPSCRLPREQSSLRLRSPLQRSMAPTKASPTPTVCSTRKLVKAIRLWTRR